MIRTAQKRLAQIEIQYCARRRLSVISARAWMFDPKRLRSLIRRRSRITQAIILYQSVFCSHLVIAGLAGENSNAVENYSDESVPRVVARVSPSVSHR